MDSVIEVGKIRKFGRYAQASCLVLLIILAVAGPATAVLAVSAANWSLTEAMGLGRYFAVGEPEPLSLAVWSLLDATLMFALCCLAVSYLYSLFGALGRGAIHTPDNVRRIRRVGQIVFALGVWQIVLPVLTVTLIKVGAFPEPASWAVDLDFGPDSLVLIVTGSLVLLVSWIMEVGRRASEAAEQMRRDAELVV
jgi:hypothetical protein